MPVDDATLELLVLTYARAGRLRDAAFLLALAATGRFLDSPAADQHHSLAMVRSLLLVPADSLEPQGPLRPAYPFLARRNLLRSAAAYAADADANAGESCAAAELPLGVLFCLSRTKPSANAYALLARAASGYASARAPAHRKHARATGPVLSCLFVSYAFFPILRAPQISADGLCFSTDFRTRSSLAPSLFLSPLPSCWFRLAPLNALAVAAT